VYKLHIYRMTPKTYHKISWDYPFNNSALSQNRINLVWSEPDPETHANSAVSHYS
jgi:hypothetical protein